MTPTTGVVVTGAAQGIGRAIAEALALPGVRAWCLDVDAATLDDTVHELAAAGADVVPIVCDLGEYSAIEQAWDRIDADAIPVTVLVNNAGIWRPRAPAIDLAPSDWRRVLEVNLDATFFMSQFAARRMRARGAGGSIVSISSDLAFRPVPMGAHYASSKAAIVNLMRALALEWGAFGIRVNTVVPGLIDTAQPRAALPIEQLEELARSFPLPRVGQPHEVAAAVAFLASEAAQYVTGQALGVNGGWLMR